MVRYREVTCARMASTMDVTPKHKPQCQSRHRRHIGDITNGCSDTPRVLVQTRTAVATIDARTTVDDDPNEAFRAARIADLLFISSDSRAYTCESVAKRILASTCDRISPSKSRMTSAILPSSTVAAWQAQHKQQPPLIGSVDKMNGTHHSWQVPTSTNTRCPHPRWCDKREDWHQSWLWCVHSKQALSHLLHCTRRRECTLQSDWVSHDVDATTAIAETFLSSTTASTTAATYITATPDAESVGAVLDGRANGRQLLPPLVGVIRRACSGARCRLLDAPVGSAMTFNQRNTHQRCIARGMQQACNSARWRLCGYVPAAIQT